MGSYRLTINGTIWVNCSTVVSRVSAHGRLNIPRDFGPHGHLPGVVTADVSVNLNVTVRNYYVIVLVLSSRSFCYCN